MPVTIDELISKKHIVRLNPSKDMIDNIEKVIEKILCDSNVEMKIIATDYVFPRTLQTLKGKQVLIWDNTYWEIYNMFLVGLADLNQEQKRTNIIIHKEYSYSKHPMILIPFAYYLALVVKNNTTAKNFAKYYNLRLQEEKIIRLGMPLNDICEYIEISKMYLAVHEQTHLKYRNNDKEKNGDLLSIKQLLDIAKSVLENLNEKFYQEEYLKSKSEFLDMVDTAYVDMRMQEELLCDTYALNNCISVYRKCWAHKYTQKEIVTKCLEAVRIAGFFNSMLVSLKTFWQDCDCDYNVINTFHVATSQRSYLSEIIACLQLFQQKLYDYDIKSKWKFDGFENNYALEDLIYSYFFSNESISFWKSEEAENIENKEALSEKFKLLHWRID